MTTPPTRGIRPFLLLALAALALAGCRQAVPTAAEEGRPGGPPWFEDVTGKMSLDFVHQAGTPGAYALPQIMGSGCALFDFDGDGRLDLYLIHNAGPDSGATNRLFRQTAKGKFEDVSAGSGVDVAGFGMGAAVGDVNRDGLPDLFVTEYQGARLFLNLGAGKFRDVTGAAGIATVGWATSAAFVDFDRDGWLDLAVAYYVDYNPSVRCANAAGRPDYCHPSRFPGSAARLYRNRGEGDPRFEEVTAASGLAKAPGPGLGVACADFTGDGWPDLFLANDSRPNHLWVNQRDGTFTEEAVIRGMAGNAMGHSEADMGVALGDVDGDGLFDLLATHLPEETPTLWRQEPRGLFRDETVASGLASPRWRGTGFGTAMGDYDQDGSLDLVMVNGRVSRAGKPPPGTPEFWGDYAERNQLFANDGKGRFRDVSPDNPDLCGTHSIARGLAQGDLDGDGALDLVVTYIAGPARVYRNVAPGRGRWLLVRALDDQGLDALGAEVTVRSGKKVWVRQVNPGLSYLSSHDPRAHFGLGAADSLDELRVLWPDGREEVFPVPAVNAAVVVRRGEGKGVKAP